MTKIRVVELFAGVGGFRLGLEGWEQKSASSHYKEPFNSPYQVIWSNQWEPNSKKNGMFQEANSVYHKNWPNNENSIHYPFDLNTVASPEFSDKIVNKSIPDHDMLVGGFPCQDYSVAGVNTRGIEGKKGVLWWNIHKILKVKRPQYVFLENVDRLLKSPTNSRGRDFAIILSTLNELGYSIEWKVINAADYGMPQRRRRIYILAYHSQSKIKVEQSKKWLESTGIFAKSFPGQLAGPTIEFTLESNIKQLSDTFSNGKFLNNGLMVNGNVVMSDFKAILNPLDNNLYSQNHHVLGDILLKGKIVDHTFFVNTEKKLKVPIFKITQPGFTVDPKLSRKGDVIELHTELDKWIYLKGRKAEERQSSKGTFYYKEGPISLIDDLKKASRTIVTSEGGSGPSRFKHLILDGEKYRRLLPVELERLNMFPDNHTAIGVNNGKELLISPSKRAFFMGNALVVGVVERIGKQLHDFIK
jgi:DNA (cytosine-5)-methyltransferase 1